MDRIQRPNRLAWKATAGGFNNLGIDGAQRPVSRGRCNNRSDLDCGRFIQLTCRRRSVQYSIALDQSEVGGEYSVRVGEGLPGFTTSAFFQQPRQEGAGLNIEVQYSPLDSLSRVRTISSGSCTEVLV